MSLKERTTHGDHAAMAFYVVDVVDPAYRDACRSHIKNSTVSAGNADDLTAVRMVRGLTIWWDKLSKQGPGFRYFPEATKSWIIVMELI